MASNPAPRTGIRRLHCGEHWKAGFLAAHPGVRRETVRAVVEHESGSPGSAVEVERLAQRVRLESGAPVGRQVVILRPPIAWAAFSNVRLGRGVRSVMFREHLCISS